MHLCVLAGVCHAELFSHRRMKTRGRGYLPNVLCTVVVDFYFRVKQGGVGWGENLNKIYEGCH